MVKNYFIHLYIYLLILGEIQSIDVVEEKKSECGEGVPIYWVEFLFNENLNELSISEQM